jgi:hypothetical protein
VVRGGTSDLNDRTTSALETALKKYEFEDRIRRVPSFSGAIGVGGLSSAVAAGLAQQSAKTAFAIAGGVWTGGMLIYIAFELFLLHFENDRIKRITNLFGKSPEKISQLYANKYQYYIMCEILGDIAKDQLQDETKVIKAAVARDP